MLTDTLHDGLESYRIGPKVHALRTTKGLGLAQLGDHTGLSAGMLSKIERGQIFPTLPTLLRIALVFGVGLDHFFGAGEDRPLLEVVRKDDRLRLPNTPRGTAAFYFESLDYPVSEPGQESYIAEFPKGAPESAAHRHAGTEMVHVLEGRVELNIHNSVTALEMGDTVTFDSGFNHSYRGTSDGKSRAIVVVRPVSPRPVV